MNPLAPATALPAPNWAGLPGSQTMSAGSEERFVSRAGKKLAFALDHFAVDPAELVCADLGSNVGGFVDCLLRRKARKVYAVDSGYGVLDWRLRKDPRVVVLERTNALDLVLPEPVQLVTIDVAWTRQQLVLPRAFEWLGEGGLIITLIKPHYEADRGDLRGGVLPDDLVEPTVRRVLAHLADRDMAAEATAESPLRGDAGNREFLALLRRR